MGVVGSTGHEPLLGGGKAMVDFLKDALRLLLRQ